MCGQSFEAYQTHQHICEYCDAQIDEADDKAAQIQRELADPALKARLAEGVRKRLEEP